ncbi:MAG TPA: hypothetical protein ENJ20_05485, partial [Bacteroidetes bacterium]|nr:hypothetical protein [Bacteroidota bacterium]
MKRPHLLIFLLLLCAVDIVRAQGDFLSRRVSFEYKNTRLKEVLNSISEKYNIKFSYSSRVINVRQRISAKATDVPLSAGLDTLFAPTPIVYSLIGHHIVLKNDPGKLLGHREMKQPRLPDSEDTGKPDTSAVLVYAKQPPTEERPRPDSAIAIEMPASRPVKRQGRMYPFDQTLLNLEKWRTRAEYALRPSNNRRLARVSLLPHISTNPDSGPGTTNNISINVLWAKSGGVDGLEAGGLVNRVNRDVIGVQLAGLGNSVGGNVTGTQVAGVFNKNDGMTRGLQAAGLINIARHLQAAQAAGAVNWAKGNMAGLQISLLLNRTAGQVRGLQVAGLMNLSGGQSKAQIAGL